jgi:three-Cys-motif partner protein
LKVFDIVEKHNLVDKISCIFNEKENEFFIQLKANLESHSVFEKIKFKPHIFNLDANNVPIDNIIHKHCPIFSFIDPFGYKNVSVNQVWKLVQNAGSDCILFFNANRIYMDLNKPTSAEDMVALFGNKLSSVKDKIESLKSNSSKMKFLLGNFAQNLIEKAGYYSLYILPFQFEFSDRSRLSHYLLLITKNFRAITIMKDIMSKFSNYFGDEFGFNHKAVGQMTLNLDDNFPTLKNTLLEFIADSNSWNKEWNVENLMKAIDDWYMRKQYTVTPFSLNDFKNTLRTMSDSNDKIRIINNTKFRKKETFANSKNFIFIK